MEKLNLKYSAQQPAQGMRTFYHNNLHGIFPFRFVSHTMQQVQAMLPVSAGQNHKTMAALAAKFGFRRGKFIADAKG